MEKLKWLKSRQDTAFEGKKIGSSEGNEKCHCEEGERPTWQSRINVLGNSKKSKIKKLNTLQPSKKAAFTLAEVLVTLGVIGVVAAMTLPTLIQNYKKTVYVNQLKKSYSMWEQAFQKMMADDEVQKLSDTTVWASKGNTIYSYCNSSGTWYTTNTNCKNFVTNLSKYLKIIGVEKYGNKMNYLGGGTPWNSENEKTFVLSDGTMIMFNAQGSPSTISTDKCNQIKSLGGNMCSWAGSIYIDVNGRRGPNTYGRDVFSFYFSDEGKLYPYYGKDYALYNQQRALENNSSHWRKNSNRCGTPDSGVIGSNVRGDGCAARIMENGWKMDY